MKQYDLIAAYHAVRKLNSTSMQGVSLVTQLKLFNLQKQLQPAYDFQIEKEKAIFEEYPPTAFENGQAVYKFDNGEVDVKSVKACQEKINELNDLDNDSIKIEPIHLSMKDAEALKPDTAQNVMAALSEVLIIDMEEDHVPQIQIMPAQ